jgi:aspartate aminotransferase/aminotransferase
MLQQYTFVCAPHPLQCAAVAALDVDMSAQSADYARRRDMVLAGLRDAGYRVAPTGGAFYVFPEVPGGGTGQEFVARCIENELLVIPGGIFSRQDTNFRISYAASDRMLERGLDVLRKLARK